MVVPSLLTPLHTANLESVATPVFLPPKMDTIPVHDITTKGKFLIEFLEDEETSFGQSMDSLLENDNVEGSYL